MLNELLFLYVIGIMFHQTSSVGCLFNVTLVRTALHAFTILRLRSHDAGTF